MFAVARTFALIGVDAEPVHVEVDIGGGLPSFTIVGLPDAAVRESRERVRSALVNSGFSFPQHRITANLAPADVRKAGPGFDLAIAAAMLVASGQLPRASSTTTRWRGSWRSTARSGRCRARSRWRRARGSWACAASRWRRATLPRRPWSTGSR